MLAVRVLISMRDSTCTRKVTVELVDAKLNVDEQVGTSDIKFRASRNYQYKKEFCSLSFRVLLFRSCLNLGRRFCVLSYISNLARLI